MSRSSGVSFEKGMSVRTPISLHTCFMRSHMRLPQGATAPSSMVRDSSGTSFDSSTTRVTPVPPQLGQAPSELKASCSAPKPMSSTLQLGHTSGRSSATAMLGGTSCPLGQR